MNKEIISALLPSAMLGDASGMEDSFRKMSVNIDRVLRSDFVREGGNRAQIAVEKPCVITAGDGGLRADEAKHSEEEILTVSYRYEKPYVVVPRVVGNE